MRILLTGGSGYLGRHVLDTLIRAGHEVTALVRSPERLGHLAAEPAVTVRHADLRDEPLVAAAASGHDVCVHAALLWGAAGTDLELADTAAAAQLFDAVGRAGARRAVLVSSTAVHRPFVGRMHPGDALTPADVYGATKAAAEMFLWAACHTHGMRGVVLRPGPIVGAPATADGAFRSDRRIAALVDAAVRAEPLRVVRGQGRQLVSVQDVARAVARASASPTASGTYLCVDREMTAWESIAYLAIEAAQSSSPVVVDDPPNDHANPHFDDTRLVTLLGRPAHSESALRSHLAHLVGRTTRT